MKALFPQFRFTQEYEKAHTLQLVHMGLCFFSMLVDVFQGDTSFNFWFLVKLIFFILFYRFMFITLRELFYTFWTLCLFISVYFLSSFFSTISDPWSQPSFFLYFLALIFLSIQAYIMSSPIFYPRIQWWIYDFRVRDDIKIKAIINEQTYNGRLTDLRRGAGCVVLFETVKIGQVITIETIFLDKTIDFNTEVISKREPVPGRGITYGVRFDLSHDEDKRMYERFSRYWSFRSRGKVRRRFKVLDDE
ncbi:MAG: hypothetical protein JNM93_09980 [Bacteriovoracaceae bacterium]|nr:hypothetical protein [Bacteriovoracaceae bacterium]